MSNRARENPSQETIAEAMRIAKSIQRPGQSKAQTKLIAQGIQKGIEIHKKPLKEHRWELDKQSKKVRANAEAAREEYSAAAAELEQQQPPKPSKLPWILLAGSWVVFTAVLATNLFLCQA